MRESYDATEMNVMMKPRPSILHESIFNAAPPTDCARPSPVLVSQIAEMHILKHWVYAQMVPSKVDLGFSSNLTL